MFGACYASITFYLRIGLTAIPPVTLGLICLQVRKAMKSALFFTFSNLFHGRFPFIKKKHLEHWLKLIKMKKM